MPTCWSTRGGRASSRRPTDHAIFSSKNPFSVGTVLVDGRVVAAWSSKDGRIVIDPFEPIAAADRAAVEDERAALEAFQA